MIEPCPECGKVPEPVKTTYEAWSITCCGLSATDPWFMGAIRYWRIAVREWREREL